MKVLISYADEAYKKSQRLQTLSARIICSFDKIIEMSPHDLDESFVKAHKEILSYKRGAGLWLWKPYLIQQQLNKLNEGDILFYCDAGCFFIRNVCRMLQNSNDDIFAFILPLKEFQFTKRDTFNCIDGMQELYMKQNQFLATYMGFRKSERSMKFVKEWLEICCNPVAITPDSNLRKSPNDINFISAREDQSIFSLLCKKYEVKIRGDISQYGRIQEKYAQKEKVIFSPYPTNKQISYIVHHRSKKAKLTDIIAPYICAVCPPKMYYILKKVKRNGK